MAVDFQSKWVSGGNTFSFLDPYTLSDDVGGGELRFDLPSATPQNVDGEYQQAGRLEGRPVVFGGVLTADTPQQLRDRWDILSAALATRGAGQFYKHGDRYITGRVVSLTRPNDDGLNRIEWSAALRCADPLWYEPAPQTQALTTATGTTNLTPGGNWFALPVFTFVVSSAGTLTVSGGNGGSFVLSGTAGTYKIDCLAGTVQVNTGAGYVDAYDRFTGNLWDEGIGPGASAITLVLSGGLALSSASVGWQRRFTSA